MPKNLYKKIEIGIMGGIELPALDNFKKEKESQVPTPFGFPSSPVEIFKFSNKRFAFLNRHGRKSQFSPPNINYKANIFAFKKLGIKYIFSINSSGSLKKKIKPGDFLVPSDYINFDPLTFYEENLKFITPELSEKLRKTLIKILKKLKLNFFQKGVYFNSKGPRLETKAEINFLKNFADIVGMEMAKEATLAQELNLEYASLCSIDNYAHGLVKKPLTIEEIIQHQNKNKKNFEKIIEEILKAKI